MVVVCDITGPEWVQALAGPVAHFHAERLRAQQSEHEADQVLNPCFSC